MTGVATRYGRQVFRAAPVRKRTCGVSSTPILPLPRLCGWLALACVLSFNVLGSSLAAGQTSEPGGAKNGQKDLGERLLRGITNKNEDDLMGTIVRLMDEASERLSIEFDPGEETQQMQRSIADRLDQAIKIAAAQRRSVRQRQQVARSDKRRRSDRQERDPKQRRGPASTKTEERGASQSRSASETHGGNTGGRFKERRRLWGNLPAREREEILQGVSERYLEQYKDWIERYYRALQESDR